MNSENNISENIIKIDNLEMTYKTQGETLTILKDLSMTVAKGDKCTITGKSGSGKSTLLNIIAGLSSPTNGSVNVNSMEITNLSKDKLTEYRQNFLGLVFQFHYLLKDFNAVENIFLPCYMAGKTKKEAMERAYALLNDVGLGNRAKHFPNQLSGGERQRIAVARSLVNEPELILADEPTGNLDPANAENIAELLFSMAEKYNKTLVVVTHDMNIAAKGNKQYKIEGGKLV